MSDQAKLNDLLGRERLEKALYMASILRARWADEREYEKIEDYEAAMSETLGVPCRISKRPWIVRFSIEDRTAMIRIKGNRIEWGLTRA